ncbi:hypothetical protein BC834DRAFT_389134 [Gloeopeniophorella convolvens]|nr:hypothetical protein BC834DRAFT_389134 [Gloeopeniophorella convolvens]
MNPCSPLLTPGEHLRVLRPVQRRARAPGPPAAPPHTSRAPPAPAELDLDPAPGPALRIRTTQPALAPIRRVPPRVRGRRVRPDPSDDGGPASPCAGALACTIRRLDGPAVRRPRLLSDPATAGPRTLLAVQRDTRTPCQAVRVRRHGRRCAPLLQLLNPSPSSNPSNISPAATRAARRSAARSASVRSFRPGGAFRFTLPLRAPTPPFLLRAPSPALAKPESEPVRGLARNASSAGRARMMPARPRARAQL